MSVIGHAAPSSVPQNRTVSDAIRRGGDNAIANWQLLALRIGEAVVIGIMTIAGVAALIVPIIVSLGFSKIDLANADNAAELLAGILIDHWVVLVYVLLGISVWLLVVMGIHSFVIAGVARVLVRGEAAAGPAEAPRQRFAAFTLESWLAGGREVWWTVFWIYNIAYGVAGMIIMLPLLPLSLLVILTHANPAALVVSCLGMLVLLFVSIVVLVVTSVVCQKAIVLAAKRPYDAITSLRLAWRAMRADSGRHFGVAFIMIVIGFGGSGAITGLSLVFAAPSAAAPMAALLFMPVRLALSFISSVFSAAVSNWFIASFAAITGETS